MQCRFSAQIPWQCGLQQDLTEELQRLHTNADVGSPATSSVPDAEAMPPSGGRDQPSANGNCTAHCKGGTAKGSSGRLKIQGTGLWLGLGGSLCWLLREEAQAADWIQTRTNEVTSRRVVLPGSFFLIQWRIVDYRPWGIARDDQWNFARPIS
jgi:hypothetical protein